MKKSPLVKYIICSTAVFLLLVCFGRQDNVIRWVKASLTVHQQNSQIERFKSEISDLDKQIESMSNDVDTLEKYARENFFFAEPGDDVFITPED